MQPKFGLDLPNLSKDTFVEKWGQRPRRWQDCRRVLNNPWSLNLLLTCLAQLALLLGGAFVSSNKVVCAINQERGVIDCQSCVEVSVSWADALLLGAGMCVVGLGILSVILKDEQLCNVYGLCMMFFAFAVGVTSVLISFEIMSFSRVISRLSTDAEKGGGSGSEAELCRAAAEKLLHGARARAIIYGLNCVADALGAVFALSWKTYLSYEKIADYQTTLMASANL